jgi:hypothetical protein
MLEDEKKNEFIYVIMLSYILFGFGYIYLDKKYPNWFFALTIYFGFKWLFNYRKCTISYIEVKLSGVKKEEGYLYRFLNYLIDFRYDDHIYKMYVIQFLFIGYHYIKTG